MPLTFEVEEGVDAPYIHYAYDASQTGSGTLSQRVWLDLRSATFEDKSGNQALRLAL